MSRTRPIKTLPLILLALTLLPGGGCATRGDVERIVERSNAAIAGTVLAAGGERLDPAGGAGGQGDWRSDVERIEAFIAANPDLERTNNALRIREAVLLLNAGQTNLAAAVFDEIDPGQLAGTRDLALHAARDELTWWYGLGPTLTEPDAGCRLDTPRTAATDCARALAALDRLAQIVDQPQQTLGVELGADSDIRRYLEQLRVRIALKLAEILPVPQTRELLDEALARYAGQFDAGERAAIQAWHLGQTPSADSDVGRLLARLRWYDYVPEAFAVGDDLYRGACEASCDGTDCARACRDFSFAPRWVACMAAENCE